MTATNHKVTAQKYLEIKGFINKHCKVPADDKKAMERFGYSKTTVQAIRRTKNYQEYCERVFRFHGYPHKAKKQPTTKTKKKTSAKKEPEIEFHVIKLEGKKSPTPMILEIIIVLTALVLLAVMLIFFIMAITSGGAING